MRTPQSLIDIYEELLGKLPNELQTLPYETITVEEVAIRKRNKTYYYIQLKGYKDGRTFTLKSYPLGKVYMPELLDLVYTYRALKHLSKAIEYILLLDAP